MYIFTHRKAKIMIHQTWAYEQNSKKTLMKKWNTKIRLNVCWFKISIWTSRKGYRKCRNYPKRWNQNLIKSGIEKTIVIHFILFGVGRLAFGIYGTRCWQAKAVLGNTFNEFDESVVAVKWLLHNIVQMRLQKMYRKGRQKCINLMTGK